MEIKVVEDIVILKNNAAEVFIQMRENSFEFMTHLYKMDDEFDAAMELKQWHSLNTNTGEIEKINGKQ